MTTPPTTIATELRRYKLATAMLASIIALAALAFLVFSVLGLRITADESAAAEPNFPKGGPAEFLYLDSARVAAYLAQIDGGSFNSEKQTRKLTDTISGKLALDNTAEAGGSKSEEDFVERNLTPTAASSFFAFDSALKKQHAVRNIRLSYFENDVKPLREGQFVSFQTRALLSPIYLNPYLATRGAHVLTAIFPGGRDEGLASKAKTERSSARGFEDSVGKKPRVVFSLHASKKEQPRSFVYLLPMSAALLNEEESMIKYGGGKFTVVGKVVRAFPEDGDEHEPAYVDSETLETWERPLRNAPGELICRTDPRCASIVRGHQLHGRKRLMAIEASRERALEALREQTEIPERGAVILPIAIYK